MHNQTFSTAFQGHITGGPPIRSQIPESVCIFHIRVHDHQGPPRRTSGTEGNDEGNPTQRLNVKAMTNLFGQNPSTFSYQHDQVDHPPDLWYYATFPQPWCYPPRKPSRPEGLYAAIETKKLEIIDGNVSSCFS
jgi:hypothetical protein